MNYGILQKSYVSAIDPMMDTREINHSVADVYNENGLIDILGMSDRKKPLATGQPVFYNWINEALFQQIIPTSVSGTGTTQLTLVLDAATSGKTAKQDIITFVDNNTGIVTNVTTASGIDTITVKSCGGANITCSTSDKLAITSVAVGEGSSALPSPRFGNTKYTNKVQIFSQSTYITDVQSAATVEVNFNGSNKWTTRADIECKLLLRGKINAQFINGDMSGTSFSDQNAFLTDQNSGGRPVQTTRGIDKYTSLYGVTLNTGGGVYTLGAVADALDNLTAQRAPLEYLVIGGKKARRKVDDLWKATGSSGVQSVRLVVGGKELDLTVDQVSYGGYTLNYVTMPILDHPILFSQTAVSKSLYYVPYNMMVKTAYEGMQPAIQARYIPNSSPFGDGVIGVSYNGALAIPSPTGTEQTWQTSYTTTQGCECLGAQWFLRQQVN